VDDKRRRILDAALVTFAERGYHGTSVPEVAEAAGVGVGTLYRYFEDKNALVNELYRDAKLRLKSALLDGLPAPDLYDLDNAQRWFSELWRRLAAFARAEPDAFRFLEMQDHVEYLDPESRALELSVLAPLWLAGKRLHDRSGGPPVDIAIALLWGAFVGLVKASRLGYLPLDDRKLALAGAAAWRMIAPEVSRANATAPRANATAPRASATAPRANATAARANATAPRASATAPRASATAPRASATAARPNATTARANATAPRANATAPRANATAPRANATAPRASATAPRASATAPRASATAPRTTTASTAVTSRSSRTTSARTPRTKG
jgi:AcrR family transcriptional regulator